MPASTNCTTSSRCANAAFADYQFAGWNPFCQTQRHPQIGRERLQISVVDADQSRIREPFQYPIEFALMMRFYEHIQAEPPGERVRNQSIGCRSSAATIKRTASAP